MPMSKEERQAYLEANRTEVEAACDRVFLQQFGRSYSDVDMRTARLPHGSENGSGRPEDTLEKIRHEFPSLFGEE